MQLVIHVIVHILSDGMDLYVREFQNVLEENNGMFIHILVNAQAI